jgi:hypothetical protein
MEAAAPAVLQVNLNDMGAPNWGGFTPSGSHRLLWM